MQYLRSQMNVGQPHRARPTQDPWIQITRPNPRAALRLFCFPYAGGAAAIYRAWPQLLPADVEICAVQPPGRERRLHEKPFTNLLTLVEAAGPALLPYMDRPFAFFGHSMGAWISFELSRYLRRKNQPKPLRLFASGCPAPHIKNRSAITHNLPDDEFIKELRHLKGTPKEALDHPGLMELMLPLLRADFSVTGTYAFAEDEPLDIPITVFGGTEDDHITQPDLEAWRNHTARAFALHLLPGDHFFIHTAQDKLINLLSREVDQLAQRYR
jgi:medium-chain acyl-[acyl-carrier-protein] hydrolase